MFQWLGNAWSRVKRSVGAMFTSTQRRSVLRRVLAGDAPGLWASDHYEETARNTGFTFCAVRALALQAAQATVTCKDIGIKRLLDQPNPNQSGAIFRFSMAQQLGLTGTAPVWTVRNQLAKPVEQYVLPTALTRAQAPTAEFPYGSYRVNPLNNFMSAVDSEGWTPQSPAQTLLIQGAEIDARDVRMIRWPHALYMTDGQSPLAAGALAMDVAEQVDRARWYALRNVSSPGMILKLGENSGLTDDEIQQLEMEIYDRNSSPHNARRNLLLPDGVEVDFRDAPNELEHAQTYTQARDAVLALHATPPVAIGVTEAGSYAAFYASMLQYVELTVQPVLSLFAEELSHVLGARVKITARRIDDPTIRQAELDNATRAGAITVNEYRARMKPPLPPVPWGDVPAGVRRTDSLDKPGGDVPGEGDETTTGVTDPTRQVPQ